MTGDDFTAWIVHMDWSQRKVANVLGLSRNSVAKYMIEGAPDSIGYACAALAFGLPKWAAG